MLEISLKQDDQEILFSRLPDTIESDAVVAMIKAVLDAHKAKEEEHASQTGESAELSFTSPRSSVRNSKRHSSEVTITNNIKSAIKAMNRLGRPLTEARDIEALLKEDNRYSGNGMETVRYLLRQLEKGGFLEKNGNGTRELTEKGKIAAHNFEMEELNFAIKENGLDPRTTSLTLQDSEEQEN